MVSKETVVKNRSGLHARPASDFVKAAKAFQSKIKIARVGGDEEEANAKSIVMLLSVGLSQGETVRISAEGEDEATAVEQLIALIDSGFGED